VWLPRPLALAHFAKPAPATIIPPLALARTPAMHSFPNAVVGVVVFAVAVVLVLGLVNMIRQGPGAGNRSQMFMRWRVGLQFLAIVAIFVALYFRPH
jgi:hypothetical protein